MALLDSLISPLLAALARFLSPFTRLWNKAVDAFNHLTAITSRATDLVQTIKDEVEAWRNFKENPNWKNRVINAPIAFDKTAELIQGIPASWRAIVDLFSQLKQKLQAGGDPKAETEDFVADIEGGEGISGLLRRFPRVVRGAEKLFGFLAIAVDALESISNVLDDLQTIVDEAARIRTEIEELDTIFLSQKNKRKTVKTTTGKKLRLRIGSLHS